VHFSNDFSSIVITNLCWTAIVVQCSVLFQKALDASDIFPRQQAYATSDFLEALKGEFGVSPLLFCSPGGGRHFINQVMEPFRRL
jgi:hypothetical protein